MKHVVGIDFSLSDTGVGVIRGDAKSHTVTTKSIAVGPIYDPSLTGPDGKKRSSLLGRRDRIQAIAARVVRAALEGYDPEVDDVPIFVIEAPFYMPSVMEDPKRPGKFKPRPSGSVHDRAWTWGLIVHTLFKHGFVVEVAPTKLKSYATGKGSGRKAGVLAAIPFMFPDLPPITNDNIADALVMAAMAARQYGFPVEPSPQRINPSALNGVIWPTFTQLAN